MTYPGSQVRRNHLALILSIFPDAGWLLTVPRLFSRLCWTPNFLISCFLCHTHYFFPMFKQPGQPGPLLGQAASVSPCPP